MTPRLLIARASDTMQRLIERAIALLLEAAGYRIPRPFGPQPKKGRA